MAEQLVVSSSVLPHGSVPDDAFPKRARLAEDLAGEVPAFHEDDDPDKVLDDMVREQQRRQQQQMMRAPPWAVAMQASMEGGIQRVGDMVQGLASRLSHVENDRAQDADKISTLFQKVDELSKLVAGQSSKSESASPGVPFFNRSRVEAFGEDPWARYNRGNTQQGPMVEPLSPYSDTDFNHVIFGGWNFDTPRRIIVSDDERVMSAVTSEQRTFIRRHVVFGQRAQTAHIFLKELTDPPADRFYALQGDHNKVHRTTGGADIWLSPSRTEERRMKNRLTTLAGETVLRLLSTESSKPVIEYNYQKQLVWADGARIAAVHSELLFARPEDRISMVNITDSKGEGMKFSFNLSVMCTKANKPEAEMEIKLHESQAAAS